MITTSSIYNAYRAAGKSVEDANQLTQGTFTHNPYNIDNPLDANGNLVDGAKLVVDTDWQKEIFHAASTYDANVSVSGGTAKSSYFFSTGYLDQEGITPSAHYKRYSASLNTKADATDWLTLGMNAKFSYGIQNTEVAGSAGASPLYDAVNFLMLFLFMWWMLTDNLYLTKVAISSIISPILWLVI